MNVILNILNLFDRCRSDGRVRPLNIDRDLVPHLALPRILVLDLLSDELMSTISRLSPDRKTLELHSDLRLCPEDQFVSGSCRSSDCDSLHLCRDFLFHGTCSQFSENGTCSHSHSLSTFHNQSILEKRQLSSNDEQIFQLISRLLQLSSPSKLVVRSLNGVPISDHLIERWLGQHRSLLREKRIVNPLTVEFSFDDDEIVSMMEKMFEERYPSEVTIVNKTVIPISNTNETRISAKVDLFQATPVIKDEEKKPSGSNNVTSPVFRTVVGRSVTRTTNGEPPAPSFPLTNVEMPLRSFSNRLIPSLSPIVRSPSTDETTTGFSRRILPEGFSPRVKSLVATTPEAAVGGTTTTFSGRFDQQSKADSPELSSFSKRLLPTNVSAESDSSPPVASATCSSHPIVPVLRGYSPRIKSTPSPDRAMTYVYARQFNDHHLSFLLGPGREFINDRQDGEQILSGLPSGFCRVTNKDQGKLIEKQLYQFLPEKLNIDLVKFPDNHFELLLATSTAEKIFEQNQTKCAIISEVIDAQVAVEVIPPNPNEQSQSAASSRISDGKFHVDSTGSTINVVSGDLSECQVDMLVCVTTSHQLLRSVLTRAGHEIESLYEQQKSRGGALILDGGQTNARKILFVPWHTEVASMDIKTIQKSLTDLVKWCIDQSRQLKMKSIAFPPIGTGLLSVEADYVCEAMMSGASQRLHQDEMHISFVIFQSSGSNKDQRCFQVFRSYLDGLCQEMTSKVAAAPLRRASSSTVAKTQLIQRRVRSKRLLTLSSSIDMNPFHNLLVKSLEKLLIEKRIDLSLIGPSIVDQFDLLIDICLTGHVVPRLDLLKKQLIVRGDRDSCSQCLHNLVHPKEVYRYSYLINETEEHKFDMFLSLKIGEAITLGDSDIRLEDGDGNIFNTDLQTLEVQINRDRERVTLIKNQLNADSKVIPPSSWSNSSLLIRTVEVANSSFDSLDCFQLFRETMNKSEWDVEKIYSIENWPCFVHFNDDQTKNIFLFHGSPFSSVQSIIHYGFYSTYCGSRDKPSICLTRDAWTSHLLGSSRSTDGKHYLFVAKVNSNEMENDRFVFSNSDAHRALPTHLIIYQKRTF